MEYTGLRPTSMRLSLDKKASGMTCTEATYTHLDMAPEHTKAQLPRAPHAFQRKAQRERFACLDIPRKLFQVSYPA